MTAGPAALAADAAGWVIGGALAGLGLVRRAKPAHPHGATYHARVVIEAAPAAAAGSVLLGNPGEHDAVVRFSRSVGVPRPVPDLLGMSLRLIDAYGQDRHQDLLLVTCGARPLLHHVFLPAADVQQRPYSSGLPYSAGADRFVVGALPDAASPRPDGDDELDRLARAAATGRLTFGLAIAPLGEPFRRVGTIHVAQPLPDVLEALRYNPFHTGGGLYPAGLLNRMRRPAYPLAQRVRGRAGQATAQREADAALRANACMNR